MNASLTPMLSRIVADSGFAEQCLQWLSEGDSTSEPWSSDQDGNKPCSPHTPNPTRHDFATALFNALRDAADALVPAVPAGVPPSAPSNDLCLSSDHEFPSLGGRTTPVNDRTQPQPTSATKPPTPVDQARAKNSKPKRKIQPSRVTDVRKDTTFTDAAVHAVQRTPPTTAAQPRV